MCNQNFHTPGTSTIVKQIIQGCILCRLNRNKYKRSTTGNLCEHQDESTVGREWQADIGYLPRSKGGHKYVLIFAEKITSYIAGIQHVNSIPKRSQSIGSSEVACKLLKQQLGRLCATADEASANWELQLPRTIETLNLY